MLAKAIRFLARMDDHDFLDAGELTPPTFEPLTRLGLCTPEELADAILAHLPTASAEQAVIAAAEDYMDAYRGADVPMFDARHNLFAAVDALRAEREGKVTP